MNSRAIVLDRIRRALSDQTIEADRGPVAGTYVGEYRVVGTMTRSDRVDTFTDRLRDYGADVVVCTSEDLAESIANLVPDGAVLIPVGLDRSWLAAVETTRLQVDDAAHPFTWRELDSVGCVVTASRCSIAETGTIVLDHDETQGRRALTLLPDCHICVVHVEHLYETVPEAIRSIDAHRPLTFISGPSATSDIELHRVQGVHGPRQLAVVIVVPERSTLTE
jgi:L-lactate dehydrogenase complex protein LldG